LVVSAAGAGAAAVVSQFPRAAAAFGARRLAAMAALSRFVGMVCPGLHSVFVSLRFVLGPPDDESRGLRFSVRSYDDRYKLFIVDFAGAICGELRAFVRPRPQSQPSLTEIRALIAPDEFSGTRSLVLGGSRGLGEVVAKVLAAGNADVTISYAVGEQDARRVAEEINAAGAGRCSTLKLDITVDSFARMGLDAASLGTVYYFPTPRIFRRAAGNFDRRLFAEFIDFYTEKLSELCSWLDEGAQGPRVNVYFPSTVAIADRPKGMTEYAMAKAAAEVLAHDLNRALRHVRIVSTRLPRMLTDQTASIVPVRTASVLEVLLPVVRTVQARESATTG
jgi:NAD(P)-dependent dehydrogenase (short-subunit alcohol dehydrogenase family)